MRTATAKEAFRAATAAINAHEKAGLADEPRTLKIAPVAPTQLDTPTIFQLWDRVCAISPDFTEETLIRTWNSRHESEWLTALLIYRVDKERLWEQWTYPVDGENKRCESLSEWGRARFGVHKSTICRLRKGGALLVEKIPEHMRERFAKASPYAVEKAADLIEQQKYEAAHQEATAPKTEAQRAHSARERQPERHEDTSGRRVYQRDVTANTHGLLIKCENGIRHQLGRGDATEDEVLHMLAAEFLSGFVPLPVSRARDTSSDELATLIAKLRKLYEIRGEILADIAKLTKNADGLAADVLEGRVVCLESGSWSNIEYHHCPPRSHNFKNPETGELWDADDPRWPQVPLNSKEHQKLHQNFDGTWRTYAKKWAAKYPWFEAKLKAFLGERELSRL